jgi:hypothetical protein
MNRTINILFVVLVACNAVGAQRQSETSSLPGQSSEQPPAHFIFKPTYRLQIEQAQNETRATQPQPTISIAPPRFVIKNGALFLDFTGNGALIPVPGGGASGCFGWDSEKKFYELSPTFTVARPNPSKSHQ